MPASSGHQFRVPFRRPGNVLRFHHTHIEACGGQRIGLLDDPRIAADWRISNNADVKGVMRYTYRADMSRCVMENLHLVRWLLHGEEAGQAQMAWPRFRAALAGQLEPIIETAPGQQLPHGAEMTEGIQSLPAARRPT